MNKTIKLTIELVPSSCWYSNVRSNVRPQTWDRLQSAAFHACQHRCEVCGRHEQLDCHEVWEYDDTRCIQRLVRLCGLCRNCHQVKHFGLAVSAGRLTESLKWFCLVNDMSGEDAGNYIEQAFQIHRIRSAFDWEIDLAFLKKAGVNLGKDHIEMGLWR